MSANDELDRLIDDRKTLESDPTRIWDNVGYAERRRANEAQILGIVGKDSRLAGYCIEKLPAQVLDESDMGANLQDLFPGPYAKKVVPHLLDQRIAIENNGLARLYGGENYRRDLERNESKLAAHLEANPQLAERYIRKLPAPILDESPLGAQLQSLSSASFEGKVVPYLLGKRADQEANGLARMYSGERHQSEIADTEAKLTAHLAANTKLARSYQRALPSRVLEGSALGAAVSKALSPPASPAVEISSAPQSPAGTPPLLLPAAPDV